MASRFLPRSYLSPIAGLVLNAPPRGIDRKAWVTADNVRFRDGAVEKVRGYRSYATAGDAKAVSMVKAIKKSDGTTRTIVGTREHLYELSGTPTLTALNAVAFAGGANDKWEGDQLLEAAYFALIANNVQTLAAGGVAVADLGGSPPKARYLTQFQSHIALGHLEVSGSIGPQYVAFSDIETEGGPTDWAFTDPASEADERLIPEGNTFVQRIIRLGDFLAIYKENSVHLATYIGLPDVYNIQQAESSRGAISGHSVVDIGGQRHLYVSDNNIYLFSGGAPAAIGDAVWSAFLGQVPGSSITPIRSDSKGYIWSYHDPRLKEVTIAYRSTAGAGANDKALIWNYGSGAWSTRDWPFWSAGFHNITAATNAWTSQTQNWNAWSQSWSDLANLGLADFQTVAGDASGNLYVVEEPGQFDAAGTDTNATLESGDDDLGDYTRNKIVGGMWVDLPAVSGTNALEIYVGTRDKLTDAIEWNTTPYTASESGRVDFMRSGRWWRWKFVKRGGYFVMREYAPLYQYRGNH